MRKNKGITLIALVITIVVLIVVAAVGSYAGTESLKDAKEKKQIAELNMMRQPVLENYTKYVTTNNSKYIRGQEVPYADMQNLINKINDEAIKTVTLKATKGYYRLSTKDLEEMGITQVEDTYIVNYQTGEIINETLKVTRTGIPLYTYSTEANT